MMKHSPVHTQKKSRPGGGRSSADMPAKSWRLGEADSRHEQEARHMAQQLTRPMKPGHGQQSTASSTTEGGTAARQFGLGRGHPLSPAERYHYERALGHDFSQVRVHSGSEAAAISDEVGANAFTAGTDIVFGQNRYAPETADGSQLLAHELTHVAQSQAQPEEPGLVQQDNGGRKQKAGLGRNPPEAVYTVADGRAAEDDFVLFPYNNATLSEAAKQKLAAMVAADKSPITVEIHGYASMEGNEIYNRNLSAHRAVAVRQALEPHLPAGSRVVVYARGETGGFEDKTEGRRVGIDITRSVTTNQPAPEGGAADEPINLSLFGWRPSITFPQLKLDLKVKPDWPVIRPSIIDRSGDPDWLPDPYRFSLSGEEKTPDWRGINEPLAVRGIGMDYKLGLSVEETWNYSYNLWRFGWGLPPDLASKAADLSTTKALDATLSRTYPTSIEESNRQYETITGQPLGEITIPLITPDTLKLIWKDTEFRF